MKILKSDLLPLIFVVIYVFFGLFLSFFGPIVYIDYEKELVFIYIIFFSILFSIGYIIGIISLNLQKTVSNDLKIKNYILIFIKISLIVFSLSQLFQLFIGIINNSLNLSVLSLGEAYADGYSKYERGTGKISFDFLVQTLFYLPYLISLILGLYYYKNFSIKYKLLIIFSFLSVILIETIGSGKQKQFGDILVIIVMITLIKSNIMNKNIRKIIFKRIIMISIFGILILSLVLYLRYNAIGIDIENINEKIHPLMSFDKNHIFFNIFGPEIGFPLAILSSYFSQGYYGLSLCLETDFEWTFMVGNSYSITVLLEKFFGVPISYHDTYPYRTAILTGWDDSKWSTAFSWYAGDFTFLGTLVFFAFVGVLYGITWKESYQFKNPISILLFINLTIGILYIPANNQLFHSPGSVIAMFIIIIFWFFNHRKYNIQKKFNDD